MTPPRPRVLALVGPTGTGKTELACAVARRSGAEIVSADSMQVYRGMDVGTAKPSHALRAEIPHHALDLVAPDEPMSAGRWAAAARAAALEIAARGRPVLLVGGTGLYARAFAGGLIPGAESDPELRAALEARSDADLRAELERRDPRTAARIPARDRVRTVRALEVLRLGARTISEAQARHRFADRPFELRWLGLGLDRELLARRLRERVAAMFAAGWVEEVRALRAAGFGAELRPMRAIGYREVGWLLEGQIGEPEARERIWIATRRYAKRQRTWFRAEPGLEWIDAGAREAALERALAELSRR
ncbi:MAG TPA: tRNA (adenosine(37)-N6)-dimethylallyltransferase MiaA [Myxococcota bacterium]|nr:tRNA (adenosine(37)-N6)-dimethylallyltransferase MiaA [Myxococcota bacterium]